MRVRSSSRFGGATADDVTAKTTMLVVGAEGFGWVPVTRRRRASKLAAGRGAERAGRRAHRHRLRGSILPAGRVPTAEALKQQYHAVRDLLARYRSLREDHLRYLVKCGLIRPVLRTNADTFFAFPGRGR